MLTPAMLGTCPCPRAKKNLQNVGDCATTSHNICGSWLTTCDIITDFTVFVEAGSSIRYTAAALAQSYSAGNIKSSRSLRD